MPLRTVAVLVPPHPAAFELGVVLEVFGVDRTADGVPPFEVRVCAMTPGVPIPMNNGLSLVAPYGLDAVAGADLVAIPATPVQASYPQPLLEAIRHAYAAGASVLTVCSGVFLLAATGLLDGRTAACHWFHAEQFARHYPSVRVDPDVLFVDEGRIITSAGTAAGIDACLHLVRRELGAEVATTIARRMVVPPQRDGGQRQYVDRPIPISRSDALAPLSAWMIEHLDQDLPVSVLARQALMSERTFARRFAAETGTTPAKWLAAQRVQSAQRLLEQTTLTIEQIAGRTGFGSPTVLRAQFTQRIGISPAAYRRRFACPVPLESAPPDRLAH